MATTYSRRNAVYEGRPVQEFDRHRNRPVRGLAGFLFDCSRGACAGLLTLLGGLHIIQGQAAETLTSAPATSMAGVLEKFAAGGLTGPIELIAGVALFVTARPGMARLIGLLAFIGFVTAYVQGYNPQEILAIALSSIERIVDALQTTAIAESAAS